MWKVYLYDEMPLSKQFSKAISPGSNVPAPRPELNYHALPFCIRAKLKPAFVFRFATWMLAQIQESLARFLSALKRIGV